MSNFKNCKRCKKLFNYMGSSMCPACASELDDVFVKVRSYLEKHPNASMLAVIEDNEVSEKDVIDFLKEGRLSYAPGGSTLKCEKCGKAIPSGRMCDVCKTLLSHAFASNIAQSKNASGSEKQSVDMGKKKTGMHVKITES